MWIKIVIGAAFIGILLSLGSGLFYLVNDKGQSDRAVRALSIRIGLSIGLFLFIMLMVGIGAIKPHGVYPEGPPAAATPQK